jgi:hypothetical protein
VREIGVVARETLLGETLPLALGDDGRAIARGEFSTVRAARNARLAPLAYGAADSDGLASRVGDRLCTVPCEVRLDEDPSNTLTVEGAWLPVAKPVRLPVDLPRTRTGVDASEFVGVFELSTDDDTDMAVLVPVAAATAKSERCSCDVTPIAVIGL